MKDRTRSKESFSRKSQYARIAKERVLIVCEGEKTEPLYFHAIRQKLRLSTAYLFPVQSENGTNPMNVVQSAFEMFNTENAWDRVYCVFDRDSHQHFCEAIKYASEKDGKLYNDENSAVCFKTIISDPCFELWLLLHFETVTAETDRRAVQQAVKRYIKKYKKGYEHAYKDTEEKLEIAFSNAEKIAGNFDGKTSKNPFTNVNTLVDFLLNKLEIKGNCPA